MALTPFLNLNSLGFTKISAVFSYSVRPSPSPPFFSLASNAFPDFGSVGQIEKKPPPKKITRSLSEQGPRSGFASGGSNANALT